VAFPKHGKVWRKHIQEKDKNKQRGRRGENVGVELRKEKEARGERQ
jgi:hypothetical protein